MNKLIAQNIDNIINQYKSGVLIKDLMIQYKASRGAIVYNLRKNGIGPNATKRLKGVNHNYLDKLDTPNKAYFLGFMYADGCIITKKRGQKQIVINLHEDDVDILLKFKKELQFEGNLHFYNGSKIKSTKNYKYKRSNLYRLTVSSDRLCNNLIRLGCYPRKSKTCKFPNLKQVPAHLMSHFIRGLFDGDGYISKMKTNNSPRFTWGIVGTKNICLGVRSWLSKNLILNPNKKIRFTNNVYGIYYAHNKDIVKIFNFLYLKSRKFFLKRKFVVFKDIFKYKYKNILTYKDKLNMSIH